MTSRLSSRLKALRSPLSNSVPDDKSIIRKDSSGSLRRSFCCRDRWSSVDPEQGKDGRKEQALRFVKDINVHDTDRTAAAFGLTDGGDASFGSGTKPVAGTYYIPLAKSEKHD